MHGNVLQFGRSCVVSPETARLPQKASCSQATGFFRAPTTTDAVRAQSGALPGSASQSRSVAPWQVRAMASLSNRRNQQPGSRQGEVQGHFARLLCEGPRARRKNLRPRGCRQILSIAPLRAARNESGIRPTATDRRFEHTTQKAQSGQKTPL